MKNDSKEFLKEIVASDSRRWAAATNEAMAIDWVCNYTRNRMAALDAWSAKQPAKKKSAKKATKKTTKKTTKKRSRKPKSTKAEATEAA